MLRSPAKMALVTLSPFNKPWEAIMVSTPPLNPAGAFEPEPQFSHEIRTKLVGQVAELPQQLRQALEGLSESQLETKYKNWTIRQIAHHIADSHLHSIIRFKWALTEKHPTIKAYEEADWVELPDAKSGDLEPSLRLLEGLHVKWCQLLDSMEAGDFARTFYHPQSGESVSLWLALNNYAWHGRHHTGQILWLREQNGW